MFIRYALRYFFLDKNTWINDADGFGVSVGLRVSEELEFIIAESAGLYPWILYYLILPNGQMILALPFPVKLDSLRIELHQLHSFQLADRRKVSLSVMIHYSDPTTFACVVIQFSQTWQSISCGWLLMWDDTYLRSTRTVQRNMWLRTALKKKECIESRKK